MKYFSDVLNKVFDNEKDCLAAEKAYKAKIEAEEQRKKEAAENKKARAKEVEDALQAVISAKDRYNKLLEKFCEDYGSFHCSFNNEDSNGFLSSFLDWF